MLVDLPASEFCDPVRASTAKARRDEDELIEAFQAMRAAGGVMCTSGGPPTSPASPARLDPRLMCAARVLAADINTTRSRTLTDSAGRNTTDRMLAAGYDPLHWAESLALNPDSTDHALSLMMEGANACEGLTDSEIRDIGVASVGSARVITLASP